MQQKAVIYCRVSSQRQKDEGHGLDSQALRCEEYAAKNGYKVEKIFRDSFSGGGDFMRRPAMAELLAYIDKNPTEQYVVIFDDLKRFARDVEFHLKLRAALLSRGVTPKCLNFNFDDTPEGKYVETILAAGAELERNQNRRQVIQKQGARLAAGYWSFFPPTGYKYIRDPMHGKLLSPDEPDASIIKGALEGYAYGLLADQVDVQKYLEQHRYRNGKRVYLETVKRTLMRAAIYGGFIEYPEWNIPRRKGYHAAIISAEVVTLVEQRLNGAVRTWNRKDLSKDFVLRGFIKCEECKRLLTASWSSGRYQKYAFYRCQNKECAEYGKSIRRNDAEDGIKSILQNKTPRAELIGLAEAIVLDAWKTRQAQLSEITDQTDKQIQTIEQNIEKLLDRVTASTSVELVKAYEDKIEVLTKEKNRLKQQKAVQMTAQEYDYGTVTKTVLAYVKSPYDIWKSGELNDKRLVLRLVFAEPIEYRRGRGYGTAKLSEAVKLFEQLAANNSQAVEMGGIEPPCRWTGSLTLQRIASFLRPEPI